MTIDLYREPAQKLIRGKGLSIIVDRGDLHKAI